MLRNRRLAAVLALLLGGSAFAQDLPPDDASVEESVSLKTRLDESDRFTIPTHIDGKGPFPFLVDTGSQTTIISHELANSLALKPDATMKIVSMSGPAVVDTVAINRLSYGHGDVEALKVPVLSRNNLGAVGLLGLDSLQSRKLVIDNRKGTMQISNSRAAPSRDAIVVEARSRFGQLILVDSTVEGRKVAVIIDTGAQHSIGNIALYTSLWRREKLKRAQIVKMTSVLGEEVIGHWGVVDRMRVGDITVTNAGIIFTDAAPFHTLELNETPALLLGMDVLGGFTSIEVDFRRRQVNFYLPRGGFTPEPLKGMTHRE